MDTVIAAFENPKFGRQVDELLEGAGVAQVIPCSSGDQVRRLLQRQGAGCVICGPHLTDGPSEWLCGDLPPSCLMLMVGPQHQLDLCGSPDVFKLPTPLRREETLLTVRLLLQFSRRMERALRASRAASDQREIDRAKRALMECRGLTEEEAHRRLQKRSMDEGLRLVQTARRVLAELEQGRPDLSAPPAG